MVDKLISDLDVGTPASDTEFEILLNAAIISTRSDLSVILAVYDALTATLTNKTIDWTNNTITFSSLEALTACSDETGTGALTFATSPTFVTPALGTPASCVATNLTGTSGITGLGTLTQTVNMGDQELRDMNILKFTEATTLTISAGAIAFSVSNFRTETESSDATDELDNVTGGENGDFWTTTSVSGARDPTLTDLAGGGGQLQMNGNFTLTSLGDTITFKRGSTDIWLELSRSDNGSWGWKCPNYVAYFTDDDETKIISEMKRNPHNIVPSIQVNHQNVNDVRMKYFDGSTLRLQAPTALTDRVLFQRLKALATVYLPKHRIQKDNSLTTQQKENKINALPFFSA